jgi:hypothetical protein
LTTDKKVRPPPKRRRIGGKPENESDMPRSQPEQRPVQVLLHLPL